MKKLLYSKYVVHGVREIPYETGYIIETTLKGERAQYYTMYGIDCDGHEMAVADFKKKADAKELADELNRLLTYYLIYQLKKLSNVESKLYSEIQKAL